MSGRDVFWEQVHAALDARGDPLDLPEVQRGLAEDPARLGQLAALRSGLDLLASRRRRRVRSFATAAALVALLGAGAWLTLDRGSYQTAASGDVLATVTADPAPTAPAVPRAEPEVLAPEAGPSRVLAFRAEVTVEGPHARRTATFDGRRLSVTSESHAPAGARPYRIPSFVAVASSNVMSR